MSTDTVFVPDIPPDELTPETDAFGHRDYAAALASALVEAKPPFTIGLFAPWGLGKTTIIEAIAPRVRATCAVAIFDAWRYDGDTLRRQFIREVARQLSEADELEGYDIEKELKDLDVDETAPGERQWGINMNALVRGGVAALVAGLLVWSQVKYHPVSTGGAATSAVVSALVTLALFALAPITQIVQVSQRTETRRRVVDPEKFTEKFEDILACMRKQRLVLAIDNLDRCTPERMEEVFEALNTYLEPAGSSSHAVEMSRRLRERRKRGEAPEAVFVVAADDQALRRHLEAREAKLSKGAPNRRDDVGRYADEYLRKIFKTSIPIKPVLDADIRQYINNELSVFCAKRRINENDRRKLIQLIMAALRKNPRRVRQFVKNLELRLRLLEQRYESGELATRLSTDVLMVAKLLLLEEEWPCVFEALERDSRKLDAWHQQQLVGGEETDMPDSKDQLLLGFLAVSRSVRSPHLPAFLSLKQSRVELKLPRYAEFRDALLANDSKTVEEIVAASTLTDRQRYANELVPILNDELRGNYLENARVLVETAVEAPSLLAEQSAIIELVRRVALHPALRKKMAEATPGKLLQAATLLDQGDFDLIVDPFLDLASFKGDHVRAVAQALAPILGLLPSDAKATIRKSIEAEDVVGDFSAYLPLAQEDSDLLPAAAVGTALDAFSADYDLNGPAFCVIELGLPQHGSEDVANRLLTVFAESIGAAIQSPDAAAVVPPIADATARVVPKLTNASDTAVNAFNDVLQSLSPAAVGAGVMPHLLDVFGVSLELRRDDTKDLAIQLVNAIASQDPQVVIGYAISRAEKTPRLLKTAILELLDQMIKSGSAHERQQQAAEGILAITPGDNAGYLSDAVKGCIAGDNFASALLHLDNHAPKLADARPELAGIALERLQVHASNLPEDAITLSLALAGALDQAGLEELEKLLAQHLVRGSASSILRLAESSTGFASQMGQLLADVWEFAKAQPEPPIDLLEPLVERWDGLEKLTRAAFCAQSRAWLTALQQARAPLAQTIQHIPRVAAAEKLQLTEALLEAELLEPRDSTRTRALLISTAKQLVGRSARASKLVAGRVAALRSDDEFDAMVISGVSAVQ